MLYNFFRISHIGAMRIREINHQFIFTLKHRYQDGVQEYEVNVSENSYDTINKVEKEVVLCKNLQPSQRIMKNQKI